MPSPAFSLFCSWTPYCLGDWCPGGWLLLFRNFKLNPVIAFSRAQSYWCSPANFCKARSLMEINPSAPGWKTCGTPAEALRAQPRVGPSGRLWAVDKAGVFCCSCDVELAWLLTHICWAEVGHFPARRCDWIACSLASPEELGSTGRTWRSESGYGAPKQPG